MRDFKLLFLTATLSIYFAAGLAYSANSIPQGVYSKPTAILDEIKSKGARAVVSELYDDQNVWQSMLQKIASGNLAWLKVAVALHPVSDAGSSEMLTLAVGEALENDPKNVFKIALGSFKLGNICSGPDVDDARYDSYELSMKAINRRIKKVAAIKDQSLMNTSKECTQYLEKSRKGIAQFYEIKKK
jgi:hypothetical protein